MSVILSLSTVAVETDFIKYNGTYSDHLHGSIDGSLGHSSVNLEGKDCSKLQSSFDSLTKQEVDVQKLLGDSKDRWVRTSVTAGYCWTLKTSSDIQSISSWSDLCPAIKLHTKLLNINFRLFLFRKKKTISQVNWCFCKCNVSGCWTCPTVSSSRRRKSADKYLGLWRSAF